jgi:hypothetical protein
LPEANPVLVYSMRKVGSTSLTSTLRNSGHSVYKHHCIVPTVNAELQHALARTGIAPQHWLTDGARFQKRLRRWRAKRDPARDDRRLKIFTFVKDPLAVALSDYFMQLFEFMPHAVAARRLDQLEGLRRHFQEVLQAAVDGGSEDPLTDFLARLSNMPRYWFEREFMATTHIDVLASEFPIERGYGIYRGDDTDAVLIRTDRLSAVALDAIEYLTGNRPLSLIEKNVRAATAEGKLYRALVAGLGLPERLVHQFYNQPWLRHFYSAADIENMIARWSRAA